MFLPKGNVKRLNALCPYCLSLERVRLLDLFLANETDIYYNHDAKILHFAPENALFKKLSANHAGYIDADINPANARHVIDITNIESEDNFFDYIICSHVLGHVPDEAKAVNELYRVLKVNGMALIITLLNSSRELTFEDADIISPASRLKFYGEPDLCRIHGRDFADRLSQHGFNVERIDYREMLPDETVVKNCLGNGEREIIFRCKKAV